MSTSKITGRRLALHCICKYGHSGKIDYDQDLRATNRKAWRQVARLIKRRVKRRLDRDLRDQLESHNSDA